MPIWPHFGLGRRKTQSDSDVYSGYPYLVRLRREGVVDDEPGGVLYPERYSVRDGVVDDPVVAVVLRQRKDPPHGGRHVDDLLGLLGSRRVSAAAVVREGDVEGVVAVGQPRLLARPRQAARALGPLSSDAPKFVNPFSKSA